LRPFTGTDKLTSNQVIYRLG